MTKREEHFVTIHYFLIDTLLAALLEKNAANVDRWLQEVADGDGETKPDPAKALDLLAKLAEYGAPKLNRSEVVGDPDNPLQQRIEMHVIDATERK